MKSKILLITLICILACVFAISINAEVTTYDDYVEKTTIVYNEDEIVVFTDGFSCPSSYIFKDSATFETDYSYINGKTGKTYTDADVLELCVPQGVTYGGYFKNDTKFTSLVKLNTGKTLEKTNGDFYQNPTLTTVIFGTGYTNAGLTTYFFNGTKVQYVIFSDNSKMSTLPSQFFGNHTTLKGIYFGNTMTNIGAGTFDEMGSTNVFLMNTPSDTEPSQVYYFKADVQVCNFYGFKTNATTTTWVFPEGVGSVWNLDGMANPPKNLVFLTDGTNGITVNEAIGSTKLNTMKLYFPNVESSSKDSIACSANTTFYFGDSKKSSYNGSWGEVTAMSQEEHVYNPMADVNKEASCTESGLVATYCFCGNALTSSETPSLGHIPYASPYEIVYLNGFLNNGEAHYYCQREECNDTEVVVVNPIVVAKGYSVTEVGSSLEMAISSGFTFNKEELNAYESINNTFLKIGMCFVAVSDELKQNAEINVSDFKIVVLLKENEQSFDFRIMDFKIVYSSNEYMDREMIACAYISDGDSTQLLQSNEQGSSVVAGMQAVSYNYLLSR